MKGVILAGGMGSRLYPLTRVTNKHLLPVYDKPMLYYPLQTLVDAGIQDILIVTGGNNAGDFLRLLRNGKDFGLKQLSFAYQEGEGGIADALRLAGPFAAGENIFAKGSSAMKLSKAGGQTQERLNHFGERQRWRARKRCWKRN